MNNEFLKIEASYSNSNKTYANTTFYLAIFGELENE
jgi:hypothetical protein